jgi:hypothetical protein
MYSMYSTKISFKTYANDWNHCCRAGAGAARSRIIWSEPAPTMVFIMVKNFKLTQNLTVYNPFSSYFQQNKSIVQNQMKEVVSTCV